MREARTEEDLRLLLEPAKSDKSIGLVPTMGFLHDGHRRLIASASTENQVVVLSIFLNPTQFGPNEDLDRYPRDLERDVRLASEAGVDILFLPDTRAMYPDGPSRQAIWVDPGHLSDHLCGASRPNHFRGVATVVTKLLNMVQPQRAYFGQKDAQQALILTRLVRDLAFPTEIRIIPTVREADGLALSSRNVFLEPAERSQAPALYRGLLAGEAAVSNGERDSRKIEARIRSTIQREGPDIQVEYIRVVSLDGLEPVDRLDSNALIALAARVGATRLIDNLIVRFEDGVAHVG